MAEREIAGRCSCPICGAPSQDVRVNVNQKLYCYCDNGCSFKFNSAQSRKFLPKLRAGETVVTEQNLVITSINRKEKTENVKIENITGRVAGAVNGAATVAGAATNTGNNAGAGRVDAGRRADNNAGNVGADSNGKPRGFLAEWFGDEWWGNDE